MSRTTSQRVGGLLLTLLVLASSVVLLIDAFGPGHVLDEAWSEDERFHYFWLWMFSWATLPLSLWVLSSPARFFTRDRQLAFAIPVVMWTSQLAAVALYWLVSGIDPFPAPIYIAGIRTDWPGVLVALAWGTTGYALVRTPAEVAPRHTEASPAWHVVLWSTTLVVTCVLVLLDLYEVWTSHPSSRHGLFHLTWANLNLACMNAFSLWVLHRWRAQLAAPRVTVAWLTAAPWVAYVLAPVPAAIFSRPVSHDHPVAHDVAGDSFGLVAALVFVAAALLPMVTRPGGANVGAQ